LIKADSGCIVPWHWHSANEELMLVSGRGSVDMTDFPTHAMRAGDYVLLPAKHHHQFTCKSKCVMFDAIADTFDIHYVDKSGQEVPVDQALSAVSEKPAPGKPTQ
jgi:quercetin dioxygenase-like cupin family protein